MTSLQVHARRLEGSLAAPVRNDTETVDFDDRADAWRHAEKLSRRGYAVWVYAVARVAESEPGFGPAVRPAGGPLHVVAEWGADGRRRR